MDEYGIKKGNRKYNPGSNTMKNKSLNMFAFIQQILISIVLMVKNAAVNNTDSKICPHDSQDTSKRIHYKQIYIVPECR
jgi:hypothetical protein